MVMVSVHYKIFSSISGPKPTNMSVGNFSGGPVVKNPPSSAGDVVQSLVRELISHRSRSNYLQLVTLGEVSSHNPGGAACGSHSKPRECWVLEGGLAGVLRGSGLGEQLVQAVAQALASP